MKLIDKDDFLNMLIEDGYFNQYQIDLLRSMIDAMPTEDIVICKDCKYYKENTLVCSRYGLEDDDYCSWAERRES